MLTWAQLGLHKKPIGILNMYGYYDLLLEFIGNMVDKGLLKQTNQEIIIVSKDAEDLLDKMENYTPLPVGKWIKKGEE